MAVGTIQAHEHAKPNGRIRTTLGYEPTADDPAATDVHVDYRRTGDTDEADWKPAPWGVPPLIVRGSQEVNPPIAAPGAMSIDIVAPSDPGTYDVRVRWTNDGRVIPGSERIGQFFVDSDCFVATAAFGSELAPEVQFLRSIRDDVLRQTRWGRTFFEDYYRHYSRISPPLADQLRNDPELRELIRWSIVTPWVNFMKLMATQPDWDEIDMDSLDEGLRGFLVQFRGQVEEWTGVISLPSSFASREANECARELGVILRFLKASGHDDYLNRLIDSGELPLRFQSAHYAELREILLKYGRPEVEIEAILEGRRVACA